MKQFFCSILKKLIFQKSGSDRLSDRLQSLEKQIEQIKLQISDAQVVKIEKVIVEKIICEKVETSYRIDSIATENLSGTMNIGTIYPGHEPTYMFNKEEKPLEQPEPDHPRVNVIYK